MAYAKVIGVILKRQPRATLELRSFTCLPEVGRLKFLLDRPPYRRTRPSAGESLSRIGNPQVRTWEAL